MSEFCAEFYIDTDEDAGISYKGEDVGSFFRARICGASDIEVADKSILLIDDIVILTKYNKTAVSDLLYNSLLGLKHNLGKRFLSYSSRGNHAVVFEVTEKKTYNVEL